MKTMNNGDLGAWLTLLENRHDKQIQLGLERVALVAQKLSLTKPTFPVITVAGTNGKGSTVAALESIYNAAGYRTGSYTSPHLLRFNERIKSCGEPLEDSAIVEALTAIEAGRGDTPLTYFEMVTLAAFWYFTHNPPDVLIVEVGLGGRLDATNVLDADLAIITTIDYDHQDYLGDTLDAIAFEKSGILRPNQWFIYADENPPKSLMERALSLNTHSFYLGRNFDYSQTSESLTLMLGKEAIYQGARPNLHSKSAAAALLAAYLLQSVLPLTSEQLVKAMQTVFIPGRLQSMEYQGINVLLDVSHNPQSARCLANYLERNRGKNIHFVFGAFKDKDISGIITAVKHFAHAWYPVALTGNRALTEEMMKQYFSDLGISVKTCYADPVSGFQQAIANAKANEPVVVFGSFHTVGPVMDWLEKQSS